MFANINCIVINIKCLLYMKKIVKLLLSVATILCPVPKDYLKEITLKQ